MNKYLRLLLGISIFLILGYAADASFDFGIVKDSSSSFTILVSLIAVGVVSFIVLLTLESIFAPSNIREVNGELSESDSIEQPLWKRGIKIVILSLVIFITIAAIFYVLITSQA